MEKRIIKPTGVDTNTALFHVFIDDINRVITVDDYINGTQTVFVERQPLNGPPRVDCNTYSLEDCVTLAEAGGSDEDDTFLVCKANPLWIKFNDEYRKIHGRNIDWDEFDDIVWGIRNMRKDGMI